MGSRQNGSEGAVRRRNPDAQQLTGTGHVPTTGRQRRRYRTAFTFVHVLYSSAA